ncbi:chitin deacetylase, partial [Blyttiomyces sp. JEL0837]
MLALSTLTSSAALIVAVAFLPLASSQVNLAAPVGLSEYGIVDWPQQDLPPPIMPKWSALYALNSSADLALPVRAPGTVDSICQVGDPTCAYSCSGCMSTTDIAFVPAGSWGLTFDDGPTESTMVLLDALKARNIKATFFVVASRILTNPEVLKRAHAEGHQIG